MDVLDLDPLVLESTATIVEGYCSKQKSIMEDYLSNTTSLSSEWNDDQTLGLLLEEIKKMKNEVINVMDEIKATYPKYFRDKAEQIRNRPKHNERWAYLPDKFSTKSTISFDVVNSKNREYSLLSLMSKTKINRQDLNVEMCNVDGVGIKEDYVQTSNNIRRIEELENVGVFLSPANGEKIFCKNIAWRQYGIGEPNAQNVCGADFYYSDNTFCGSYVGKNWRDIYKNNVQDTEIFRKKFS